MLFRTVYGPELEAIYQFIVTSNAAGINPQRQNIYAAFVPQRFDGELPSTQNVDDALAFLKSSKLVDDDDGFHAYTPDPGWPFALMLLWTMRRIERNA